MSKVASEDLVRAFSSHKQDPNHRERVIITCSKTEDFDTLNLGNVEIISRMQNLPIVTAAIDAVTFHKLSADPSVIRIERDGEMHALGNSDD